MDFKSFSCGIVDTLLVPVLTKEVLEAVNGLGISGLNAMQNEDFTCEFSVDVDSGGNLSQGHLILQRSDIFRNDN